MAKKRRSKPTPMLNSAVDGVDEEPYFAPKAKVKAAASALAKRVKGSNMDDE